MDARIAHLVEVIRPRYDNGDPGHDFAHVERVMKSCTRIAESVGADLSIVLPAALLHDVINVPKNHPDRAAASAKAAEEARDILRDAGYAPAEIERIAVVITEHSYSLGKAPSCLESAVLQDADRLDALGAVGIMRTVTCGCKMGARYYDAAEPFAKTRPLDDERNTLDHFYVKLLKLADTMNTEIARREAARRTELMHAFLRQAEGEISGTFG
ncbi:metal-dependent phosphohydrolase [Minicystis rosea]|nr:metal-dependent phosphohydrolase [Minicystis rosea]